MKRLLEESDVTDLERALLRSVEADEAPADGADRLFAELMNRSEATAPVVALPARKRIPSWVWLAAAVVFGVGVIALDRSREGEKVQIVHDAPAITVPTAAPAPVASTEPAAETQLPPPAPAVTPSAAPSYMVKYVPKAPSSVGTITASGSTSAEALRKAMAQLPDAGAEGSAPFDKGSAARALGSVDLHDCEQVPGPTGAGHVSVTFKPDGTVATVVVDSGPYPATARGGCIAGKFRAARVPPFSGAPVRVGKSFVLN